MKKLFLFIFTTVILFGVGFVGYKSYRYITDKNSLTFDLIPSPDAAATSTDSLASSTATGVITATSSADTSSWKTYSNDELGYEFKYPRELVLNDGGMSLILAFPKKAYFHWPLEDDAKLTIVASSSCSSSMLIARDRIATSTLIVDGKKYVTAATTDMGAGNRYSETYYEIKGNGVCYSLVYYNHGTNGAGFYVNDPVLIKKYDGQHADDMRNVDDVIYGILKTFRLKSSPAGLSEELAPRR